MVGSCKTLAVLLLLAATPLFAQSGPKNRILQPVNRNQRALIPGSAHPLAKPELDAGRVAGNLPINGVSLIFKPSPAQQAALEKLLREQQDRSSVNYHKWLTPEQYAARFGMSRSDLAKATAWLQSEGFQVDRTTRGRNRISFSGTSGQIETAFRTEMHHYRVEGELHFAPATDLSVPAALGGTVLAVGNLSDFRLKPRLSGQLSQPSRKPSPKFTDGAGHHYIGPADFAVIYDLSPLYAAGFNGAGQTIAVMGQTAIDTQAQDEADIDNFRAAAGLPARIICTGSNSNSCNFTETLVPTSGTPVRSAGDMVEADLDIEWSVATAQQAKQIFVYVGGAANFNAFDALTYAVDNNLAPVISISYGGCEANLGGTSSLAVQATAQQANLQGQTIVAASGDAGAADCDPQLEDPAIQGLAVDVPASIPEVTGVGGTRFNEDPSVTYWDPTSGSATSYIPEAGWNDSIQNQVLSASGGGVSTLFPTPDWQTTNVIGGFRNVPDIAFSASPDHDPYLICSTQASSQSCASGFTDGNGNLTSTGGTSFGAPAFAGIVALINQRTNSGQGNVNPTLYSLATSTPTAFHDITTGNNQVPCTTGSPDCTGSGMMGFDAGPGYDQVTGLGTLDASVLVNAWPAAFSLLPSPTSITIAAPGGNGTATLTLQPNAGFTGTVTLACTPQAGITGLTCQISPSTVTSASPAATLTVSTTAPSSGSLAKPNSRFGWLVGSGLILFGGIFLIEVPLLRRRRMTVLPALLLLAFLSVGLGCGGSSSGGSTTTTPPTTGGTPAGSYTIAVTATTTAPGTTGGTSVPMNVTVVVQ
jgi:subtilase family serine protease